MVSIIEPSPTLLNIVGGFIMQKTHVVPLPETGYVRLHQIIGNPKADPPIPAIIPVSKSTWWEGVKQGRFPQSVKLGPRTTAWRISDIRRLIESAGEAS
jgi:predicted DNA-binding transcriptional regulator AlpA